ncbi:hypothetical protein M0802_016146 [Mischocyttarus mexicanus]|nr:hypothetical protein M0802_016146 [Mischocyttarus mexicanus]
MWNYYYYLKQKHRPFSWTWLKLWCIAWWHSGREDEEEDEEIGGPESSRTIHGYEDTLTPLSVETPLTSTVSRCGSLHGVHTAAIDVSGGGITTQHCYYGDSKKSTRSGGELSTKSISSDSVCVFFQN